MCQLKTGGLNGNPGREPFKCIIKEVKKNAIRFCLDLVKRHSLFSVILFSFFLLIDDFVTVIPELHEMF